MAIPVVVFVLAYAAFVSLGLPDTVLGVAWPTIERSFGLTPAAMGPMLACGVTGYMLSGVLAGRASQRLGVGGLLALSCGLVGLALAGYAATPVWLAFLPLAAVNGLGSGAIDAALNGYAARHFAARHLNWLHACWGIGAFSGPPIMTAGLVLTGSHRPGYAVLAAVLGMMGLAFAATRRRWEAGPPSGGPSGEGAPALASVGQALRSRTVRLQALLFLCYTGMETSTGAWGFTVLQRAHGLSTEAAGAWVTAFWLALFAGRVVLGGLVDRLGADRLLRACTVGALAGTVAFQAGGAAGRAGLVLLGVALAPMFPTLMARTPARVGAALSVHAVGFQVSAGALGSALVPWALGILAARAGAAAIPPVVVGVAVAFLGLHEALLRTAPPAPGPAGSNPAAPGPGPV